jgi:predicted unusual protein kinase regulating ubiquinone biosynthesis (AarF/ABC1/UbiB family)
MLLTSLMTCCLVQVTEGPDAGKLALLDFGLVAEIPAQDRAAMVRGGAGAAG